MNRLIKTHEGTLRARRAFAIAAMAILATGCGRGARDRGDSAALSGTTPESASSRQGNGMPAAASAPAAGASLQLTDTALVQFLATVDKAEIEAGRLAVGKAKRKDVKAFGQEMIDAHRQDLSTLKSLDGMAAVTERKAPARQPSADSMGDSSARRGGSDGVGRSDPMVADLANTMQQSGERLKALGATFDAEYLDAQAMGHQRVLDVLVANTGRMMTAGVRDHVAALTVAVQKHLTRAKELQQLVAAEAPRTASQ